MNYTKKKQWGRISRDNMGSIHQWQTPVNSDNKNRGTCSPTVQAVPWLRRLVAGLPPRRPGFDPGVHVGFVLDKVALGQVFPRVLRFVPVNIIPLVFHY
jgi:hypothetical protein